MDDVQEMMEGLAINESTLFYVDFEYEFDACRVFDFCIDETDYEVQEVERWFVYDHEYPPAPYKMKINLANLFIGTPAKDNATSSMELEVIENVTPSLVTPSDCGIPSSEENTQAYKMKIKLTNLSVGTPAKDDASSSVKVEDVEHVSPSIVTPSNCGIPSTEENTQATASLSVRDLLDDIQRLKAVFKECAAKESAAANRSPKPSTTFMKLTASHLAKQFNAEDTHAGTCGRSPKLQTPTVPVTEDPKRQKLEIGFLRKVSQLKHQTSYSHKTTIKGGCKTTIPKEPKLLTEERARRRSFRSQSKAETNTHTFKALPLNRKIFESPSLAIRKKSMTDTPVFQKFHFKYDN